MAFMRVLNRSVFGGRDLCCKRLLHFKIEFRQNRVLGKVFRNSGFKLHYVSERGSLWESLGETLWKRVFSV